MKRTTRRGRSFNLLVLAGLLTAVVVGVPCARADAFDSGGKVATDIFRGLAVIERAELANMRGRFISATGLVMDFGANIRTFVDGALLQETAVTLTDSGFVSQPIPSQEGLRGTLERGTLVTGDGNGLSIRQVTPLGVDLSALTGTSGIVLKDCNGFTAALHKVSADQILNIIVQTGIERVVEQKLEVNIGIKNFSRFQQNLRSAIMSNRLARAAR